MERQRIVTLNELIDYMEELNRQGVDCYLEGRGDTTVELIYSNLFILQ